MERNEYGCKNNKMVNCGNRNGCSSCGWDKDTRNRRLTEIRRQRAKIAGLASCPFCGRQPFAIHSRAGYSIRCRNGLCIMPATGISLHWMQQQKCGTAGILTPVPARFEVM